VTTRDNVHHNPPADCPVCGERLLLTRLGCDACGTELSGAFAPCQFCSLDNTDRELLQVFLSARGNMKELERHLGVSYPTARARFDAVLGRLGLTPGSDPQPQPEAPELSVLSDLAAGTIDVDEALRRLE
jgi:hypothetical protein